MQPLSAQAAVATRLPSRPLIGGTQRAYPYALFQTAVYNGGTEASAVAGSEATTRRPLPVGDARATARSGRTDARRSPRWLYLQIPIPTPVRVTVHRPDPSRGRQCDVVTAPATALGHANQAHKFGGISPGGRAGRSAPGTVAVGADSCSAAPSAPAVPEVRRSRTRSLSLSCHQVCCLASAVRASLCFPVTLRCTQPQP